MKAQLFAASNRPIAALEAKNVNITGPLTPFGQVSEL